MKPGNHGAVIGAGNTAAVLAWFVANPCGTARECGKAIGLSECAVGRHVKKIRAGRYPATSRNPAMEEESEPTFGAKAVGLSFNPSDSNAVDVCKRGFAQLIDQMNDLRQMNAGTEIARLASVAITEMQTAQMWDVKAITWQG